MDPEIPVEEPKHKEHKKDRKKGEENKKPRHPRPQEYERNADLITIDTVLEPLPKKNQILPKPNRDEYDDKAKKCRDRIGKLIEKKKEIRAEKYKAAKLQIKGEGGVHDQFKEEIDEFKEIKERFNDVKTRRDLKRKEVSQLIDQAKANNALIKTLRETAKNSREYIEEKLEHMELRLRTADLSKEDEKNLNNEIMMTKRKMKDAEPAGNIQVKLSNAQQRKEQLDVEIEKAKQEKEPLEKECNQLKGEMDEKNQIITKLKGEIKNEKDIKSQHQEKSNKEYDQWKENKKKRLEEAEGKIKEIDAEIQAIWDDFHAKTDTYWEQKHKLDFLEWQHRVKKRKVDDIQRQKRRAEYEARDRERQREEQMKKYLKEIESCNFLINYLKDLQKEDQKEAVEQKKTEEPVDVKAELQNAAEWKKEKGLEVLQSKKSKEDEAPVKKGKKNKKRKQQKQEEPKKKFEIPIPIDRMFDSLKLTAPESEQEIEQKIAELKDREALFMRACNEEVKEEDQTMIDKIKGENKRNKKKEEKKIEEDDFPAL